MMRQSFVRVDSHTHVADGLPSAPLSAEDVPLSRFTAPLAELDRAMDRADVHQAVLIQPSFRQHDHRYLLTAIETDPERFRGIALARPGWPDQIDRLRAMADRGVTGIRFAPRVFSDDDWFGPDGDSLVRAAAALQLSVNLLVAPTHLEPASAMVARHGDVSFVIDHLGHLDEAGRAAETHLDELLSLGNRPNAFVKISALPQLMAQSPEPAVVRCWATQVVSAFGSERCMWGSDFPFTQTPDGYVAALQVAESMLPDLSDAERNHVFGLTARRLYRLPASPGHTDKPSKEFHV